MPRLPGLLSEARFFIRPAQTDDFFDTGFPRCGSFRLVKPVEVALLISPAEGCIIGFRFRVGLKCLLKVRGNVAILHMVQFKPGSVCLACSILARPLGCIRPFSIRSSICSLLSLLQALFGFLGQKYCFRFPSPKLLTVLSIHPKHRATRTASSQRMLSFSWATI